MVGCSRLVYKIGTKRSGTFFPVFVFLSVNGDKLPSISDSGQGRFYLYVERGKTWTVFFSVWFLLMEDHPLFEMGGRVRLRYIFTFDAQGNF